MTKTSLQPAYEKASFRPPIVVVLGHVDHGKTTLLDAIRKTDMAAREYGGITQGIGAYQTENITFIDTPGHEAFTKMRAQGANVADIAILVVAANDSVMPQTVESIKIIKEAKIPYLVAINKIDLPEANIDKVIQDLLRHEVLLENYGGDVPWVKISAKKGEGVKELLDLVTLVTEVTGVAKITTEELEAYVIESRLDKNRGPVATAVVKTGTLKVGEEIYVDGAKSKIRALIDYVGKNISQAGPGTPAEILGLATVPPVGAKVSATESPFKDQILKRALGQAADKPKMPGKNQTLSLILKANTLGSLEAVTAKMPENVNLLESGAGEITQADIFLAKSTGAIILGFNVKISPAAQKLAETDKVLVRTYRIIYELLDELADAAAGMLEPEVKEEILGKGEIIAEFPFEKMRVCGVKVTEGRIAKGDLAKVASQGEALHNAKVKSIRVGKEEINKVEAGKDCGVLLDPQVDFRVGDDIIAYRVI